ncbi:hypothetical protein V6N13_126693 [Hibiscus sabdariffa]
MAPNIYYCGAGTTADTEAITGLWCYFNQWQFSYEPENSIRQSERIQPGVKFFINEAHVHWNLRFLIFVLKLSHNFVDLDILKFSYKFELMVPFCTLSFQGLNRGRYKKHRGMLCFGSSVTATQRFEALPATPAYGKQQVQGPGSGYWYQRSCSVIKRGWIRVNSSW